jgi:molecular chaperone IbpA
MYNTLSISTNTTTAYPTSTGLSGTWVNSFPVVTYGGTDLSKNFIGWDEQLKDLEKIGERLLKNTSNFPPYNVIKEDDDTFVVEFALAGFSKNDVTVQQEKNALIIEGKIKEDEDKQYVHKGIATRSFSRAFALAEHVEVTGAEFSNGILQVTLERIVPEDEQPKSIKIK